MKKYFPGFLVFILLLCLVVSFGCNDRDIERKECFGNNDVDQDEEWALNIEKVEISEEALCLSISITNRTLKTKILKDINSPVMYSFVARSKTYPSSVLSQWIPNVHFSMPGEIVLEPNEKKEFRIEFLARMNEGVHVIDLSLMNKYEIPVKSTFYIINLEKPVYFRSIEKNM